MRWAWLAVIFALLSQGQQQSGARNWPCGARIDPSYFQIAEGTGGNMLLLAPWEIGDSAALVLALDRHSQTIFRLGGTLNPGPHDFRIPIDSSVESVLFSISLQCMQTADVIGPSGERPAGDGVTDLSSFVAERMVTVPRPAAGLWTIRVAGSGLAGVMVKSRSAIGLGSVQFVPAGGTGFSPVPAAGVENVMKIGVSGHPARLEAALVDAASKDIAALTLAPGDSDGTYVARFTPGSDGFRVLIRGQDAGGAAFQRVHAPLLVAR